ncbi:hypothetical protein EJV46_20600 [Roseococcus sp. SYP-B2431]|uniref:hypothetical protein n=1 Tax=Roseococcus sp. SYP-B2431 TaxID=2496640 RepID=UPI00103EA1BC|nr:hypothetical protein [Roseococcus sp. SYP-B2431]TCH96382.1 hypothetical protein EJV46_20600 [Roseococcus sp. SYP-B2431]
MQQPWLNPPGTPPRRGVPDDFSPASATMPLRGATAALALVWLILLAGRSEAIVDAAYGLPVAPGTETLIAVAEGWNDALTAIGLPQVLSALREGLATGR